MVKLADQLVWLILYASICSLGGGLANCLHGTHGRLEQRIYDPGICWESWGLCPFATLSSTATSQTGALPAQPSTSYSDTRQTSARPPTFSSTAQRLSSLLT